MNVNIKTALTTLIIFILTVPANAGWLFDSSNSEVSKYIEEVLLPAEIASANLSNIQNPTIFLTVTHKPGSDTIVFTTSTHLEAEDWANNTWYKKYLKNSLCTPSQIDMFTNDYFNHGVNLEYIGDFSNRTLKANINTCY